jgi:hypothetical protein
VLVLNWGRLIGRESAAKVWELDAVQVAYLGKKPNDSEVGGSAHSE